MDELNALEEAEAEQLSGVSIFALETDEPKAKLLAALAFIHKRRSDPKLKYGEYLKSARTKDNMTYLFTDPDEVDEDESEEDQDVDVSGGPHPDAEDRALDDAGEPTEPFREAVGPGGGAEAPGDVADAEGAVLSLDRDTA